MTQMSQMAPVMAQDVSAYQSAGMGFVSERSFNISFYVCLKLCKIKNYYVLENIKQQDWLKWSF